MKERMATKAERQKLKQNPDSLKPQDSYISVGLDGDYNEPLEDFIHLLDEALAQHGLELELIRLQPLKKDNLANAILSETVDTNCITRIIKRE